MRLRWFVRGDLDGLVGLFIDNLLLLFLILSLVPPVCGIPIEIVVSHILPASALSILVGNLFYAWQGRRLALRTGREDVTALPFGINTVSLMAYLFLIMGPLWQQTHDADLVWSAGIFACWIGGILELIGAFLADPLRRWLPVELAFADWNKAWVELKAKRESMRKSRGHLLQRGLSLGWGAWSEMLEERAAFLRLLSKGVRFKLDRRLAFGLVSWAQATYRTLRQTEGSGHMSRGVVHYKDRHLARGWTGWHAKWAGGVAARMAMRKSLGHLLNRGFGAWLEMAIERKRVWEKQGKVLSRTTSRKLGLGVDEWRAAIAPRVDLTVNALSYSINRMLALGWNAWFSTWEGANKRVALQRGVRQMINRCLPRGWGAWALGINAWRAAIASRDDPMSKALLYFMTREVVRTWTVWNTAWLELKAKRESVRKSRGHLLQRGLSLGWGAWSEMLEERAAFLRLLSKGVRFKLDRRLAFGLVSWAQATYRTLRQTEGSGHMSRGVVHYKDRHLARGWTGWHAKWAGGVAARMAMRKSLGHLLNRGFGAWLEMAIERKELLQKTREGLSTIVSARRFRLRRMAVVGRARPALCGAVRAAVDSPEAYDEPGAVSSLVHVARDIRDARAQQGGAATGSGPLAEA